jgi:mannose-6-phosphate isomerase-like protein (cupin superfamily)
MSDRYTHVNLKRDVEDMAPRGGRAPDVEARFATGSLELEKSGLSYQRLAPNARMPFGHRHEQQEELYVVVSGTGRAKLDDEIVDLEPLDALRIAPETMRNVEAGPDGIEILCFGAPNRGPVSTDIAEQAMGWWS